MDRSSTDCPPVPVPISVQFKKLHRKILKFISVQTKTLSGCKSSRHHKVFIAIIAIHPLTHTHMHKGGGAQRTKPYSEIKSLTNFSFLLRR